MAHSGQLRAQQLDDQAKIALRTESIVIAFNYRAGLLGKFNPSIMLLISLGLDSCKQTNLT